MCLYIYVNLYIFITTYRSVRPPSHVTCYVSQGQRDQNAFSSDWCVCSTHTAFVVLLFTSLETTLPTSVWSLVLPPLLSALAGANWFNWEPPSLLISVIL